MLFMCTNFFCLCSERRKNKMKNLKMKKGRNGEKLTLEFDLFLLWVSILPCITVQSCVIELISFIITSLLSLSPLLENMNNVGWYSVLFFTISLSHRLMFK